MAPVPTQRRLLLMLAVTWLTSQVTISDAILPGDVISADGAMFELGDASLALTSGSVAPHAVTDAHSVTACALGCVAAQQGPCRGLTYTRTDRRCLLYTVCSDWLQTGEPMPTGDSVTYRLDHSNCTGETGTHKSTAQLYGSVLV